MAVTDRAPLSEYVARRNNGTVAAGASVRVLVAGTGTEADVFTVTSGATELTQPLTADSRGRLAGYVAPTVAGYDVEITIDGATEAVQRIRPATPSNLSGLIVPTCGVGRNTTTSLTTAVDTAINFNTEAWDTDAMHSTGTNPSRITCTLAGVYAIAANVVFDGSSIAGYRRVGLVKNGTGILARDRMTSASASFPTELSVACQHKLAVGDYVEVYCLQNSGGSLNVLNSGADHPAFQMTWLAGG